MRRIYLVVLGAFAALLALGGPTALAGHRHANPCASGTLAPGTYGGFTITGSCTVQGGTGPTAVSAVTINGDLTLANGAALHAIVPFTAVHITGDVKVGKGAAFDLGCTVVGCGFPADTNDVVDGSVFANQPLRLALDGDTIHGNVVSNGGGPGVSQFLNFPVKDNHIDGNLVLNGWQGGWIGVIRDVVGGSVVVSNNASVVHQTPVPCGGPSPEPACTGIAAGPDTDSTEVATNTISGNLVCFGNTPAAQLGDSGGLLNTVSGKAIGECAGLVPNANPCASGTLAPGTYGGFTITGSCTVQGGTGPTAVSAVTINGDLTLANGAALHAIVPFTAVHITGDVKVGKGAAFDLGCTVVGCGFPADTNDVVDGSVFANQPLRLALDGDTIHGNVVSNGGGPGVSQFLNFPVKDNHIDGNLVLNGWQGGWIGVIRDVVGGSVVVSNNASVVHQTPVPCGGPSPEPACTGIAAGPDTDSTEVATNTISGNLVCFGNTPAAQLGDSGGLLNTVSGKKIGECAGL